jgi:hypothetical protein
MPRCQGRQCGPNGCGQACGQCPGGFICELDGGTCYDPGTVEPPDAGVDGGTDGGDGEIIRGGCGCGAMVGPEWWLLMLVAIHGRARVRGRAR